MYLKPPFALVILLINKPTIIIAHSPYQISFTMSVDDRTPSMTAPENEAELEAFRQKWREEVSTRNKTAGGTSKKAREHDTTTTLPYPVQNAAGSSTARRKDDFNEEVAPKAYHDLPDKEEQLKLGIAGQDHDRDAYREPSSALEHYEKAVEKETQGQLGESLRHYRKAFKVRLIPLPCLDDGVHESYKRKYFPPSVFKKSKATNTNASATLPRTDHHSLRSGEEALPATVKQLVDEFSQLSIKPPEPPTDLSPPEKCPIAELPEEILTHVLSELAITDVAQFMKLALVCKRLAYLVLTEQSIWKRVAMDSPYGFPAMHYDYAVDVDGFPLDANHQIAHYLGEKDEEDPESASALPPTPEEKAIAYAALTEELLHSQYQSSWRVMFRSRPRIRFNGCYISTVNYTRAGANSTNTLTWGAPVHVVTYFRYLRFFRDGSCISLLTTSEPADVVHYLTREHIHDRHPQGSMLPQAVMRDALRGRWRLSGPHSSVPDAVTGEDEAEGDVYVETEGVVPKYNYKMHLALANAGKGARNNKLAWKGFWSHNKLTDDWGAFTLRNDKAFYWSRVKTASSSQQNAAGLAVCFHLGSIKYNSGTAVKLSRSYITAPIEFVPLCRSFCTILRSCVKCLAQPGVQHWAWAFSNTLIYEVHLPGLDWPVTTAASLCLHDSNGLAYLESLKFTYLTLIGR
ncbi:uncharacterized protein MYCFIDRAFT_209258 [Pseudocercospora fijiensis CIRAD86]|uniref:F-box domain-containing protein n=1 Tax=Pseudocercospora fijiensis (strain CIRAD86) TaxID=383855 RepID=M2YJZ7_PSEFD|nr:uncharacterized protein MYCFIDRAFT_209258 [Pseudocercospora fijiensis CIRAD86]EME78085.1 hypothetical protein MYCFIDRAFT_209258 [Pseudocercospora fijiensis CIRAD86]